MKLFILIFICAFSGNNSFAQDPRQFEDPNHIKETGRLFEVKIFPGAKETKIFVAGKKAAQINISKLNIVATLNIGKEEKRLVIKRKDNYFVTSDLSGGEQIHLKLDSKEPKESEELKIKLRLKD